ncbi:hypothetical protein [Actinomadura rugatobispora]|uniref:Uncharacterized protein n=1 Tax=Actinomadura rugatobispora TaxID=1994 RepID=A0ABW0ZNS7_9ACTN|nr:hypothetical protein GCM10010200_059000 [Actinomadura rugatobispora]
MGPDLGLLLITLLGLAGAGLVGLALVAVGALMLARALAERVPVRAEGTPWPVRRTTPAATRDSARRTPGEAPRNAPREAARAGR